MIRGKIVLKDLLYSNLYTLGDTIKIELYLTASQDNAPPKQENLSFVGEAQLKWKVCFKPGNQNQWCQLQANLTDE